MRNCLAFALALCGLGCGQPSPSVSVTRSPIPPASSDIEVRVKGFCGDCHATPHPDSFPKAMWYDEVRRGFDFYASSRRTDLKPPLLTEVVNYYQERASAELAPLADSTPKSPSPLAFRRRDFDPGLPTTGLPPRMSFVGWSDTNQRVLAGDMKTGQVTVTEFHHGSPVSRALRHPVSNPAAVRECDLNANGQLDLLICDLGSFLPEDHQRGQLIWLRDAYEDNAPAPVVLLQQVGRIADVRIGDLDNDGDADLVVAEFGWRQTGGIHVLWNEGHDAAADVIEVRAERLDRRSGAIHVPVVDLDGDGRLDIVALLSQEHEVVVGYLRREGRFVKVEIYAAPDPSYGSSGIEVVDLDHDGDLDVVYTNGDTFDSHISKPYHGILWLENQGRFPFSPRQLTLMPGVLRALPADLDKDGDWDLIATAFLPEKLRVAGSSTVPEAIIWLEQTDAGRFVRHPVFAGTPAFAAADIGDFDRDGDLDLIVGGFADQAEWDLQPLQVFQNDGAVTKP